MTSRVIAQGEVSLNGVRYPIAKAKDSSQRVQTIPASIYPEKTIIGDYTRESNPRLSSMTWSDFRGGLGIDTMEGQQEVDRYWSGYLWTRHKGQVTLPALATQTDAVGTPAGAGSQRLIDLKGSMYVTFYDTDYRAFKFDGSGGWGNSVHTLPSATNQTLNIYMNGKEWAIFACTANWVRFDGSTWENETDDAWLVAFWDDRLWKITQAGVLSYTLDITLATTPTWTDDAQIPLTNQGQPQSLFTGPSASGEEILYCTTEEGLFAHDAANARWVRTGLTWPYYLRAGNEARTWRGRIYIPVGMAMYEYTPGETAVVRVMGPDRDDGLASTYFILTMDSMAGSHNDLLVSGRAGVYSIAAYPSIHAWDGRAWMLVWQDATTQSGSVDTFSLVASYSHSTHRLWWIHNERIYYMPLEAGVRNPKQGATFTYAASSALTALKTPWFHAGQRDVDKLAVRMKVETKDCTADQKVTISYALNYNDGSYTAWSAITSDGVSTLQFPTSGDAVGVAFRAIRFKVALARGDTNTTSPIMVALTLEYDKKLSYKEGFQVLLDLNGSSSKGNTAAELRSALQTAKEATTLVEFTFRDDTGNTRNYFVRVQPGPGEQSTGHDEAGVELVTVLEV